MLWGFRKQTTERMSKQVADSYDIRPSSKDLLKYVLLDGAAFVVENSYQKRANNKVTIEYTIISLNILLLVWIY